MTVFTSIEAKTRFDSLLEQARSEGEVRIKREDGQEFILRPANPKRSPLSARSVGAHLSAEEIVQLVRDSRERGE
jgi:hypothetical protein